MVELHHTKYSKVRNGDSYNVPFRPADEKDPVSKVGSLLDTDRRDNPGRTNLPEPTLEQMGIGRE